VNEAHKLLREGTADCHARVDAAFGAFDLSSPDGYRDFLTAQAHAFLPIEEALDSAGVARLLPDWAERKRGNALVSDLYCLKVHIPEPCPFPKVDNPAAIWGQIYVLEGSRLGGQMLKRSLAPELPQAFLGHRIEHGAWRTLLDRIDQALTGPADRATALDAARATFAVFEQAAGVVRVRTA
jgi:heme oxygenase (biliverdin-IX-beta and delta-forming)